MNTFFHFIDLLGENIINLTNSIKLKIQKIINKTSYYIPKNEKDKKIRVVGLLSFFMILISILLITYYNFNNRSLNKTINQFYSAAFDLDTDKLFELLPKEIQEAGINEIMFDEKVSYQEAKDIAKLQLFESLYSSITSLTKEHGSGWKHSYKILSKEKIDINLIDKYFNKGINRKLNYDEIVEVKMELNLLNDSESIDKSTQTLVFIRYKNNWYYLI